LTLTGLAARVKSRTVPDPLLRARGRSNIRLTRVPNPANAMESGAGKTPDVSITIPISMFAFRPTLV
jgi:hypothetical protein